MTKAEMEQLWHGEAQGAGAGDLAQRRLGEADELQDGRVEQSSSDSGSIAGGGRVVVVWRRRSNSVM